MQCMFRPFLRAISEQRSLMLDKASQKAKVAKKFIFAEFAFSSYLATMKLHVISILVYFRDYTLSIIDVSKCQQIRVSLWPQLDCLGRPPHSQGHLSSQKPEAKDSNSQHGTRFRWGM